MSETFKNKAPVVLARCAATGAYQLPLAYSKWKTQFRSFAARICSSLWFVIPA